MSESQIDSDAGETKGNPRLIVLDDNPGWGNFVSQVAEQIGYAASYTTSHGDYVGAAIADPPDVLVLDLFMPDKDGIEIIADVAEAKDAPFIILISGHSNALLTSAVRLGRSKGLKVVGALVKPFRLAELRKLLQEAAGLVAMKKERGDEICVKDGRRESGGGRRKAKVNSGPRRRKNPPSPDVEAQGNVLRRTADPEPSESSSLKILRGQCNGLRTGDIVKGSIAAINERFCLALWETRRVALTALNDVPDRLAEAASAVIAERSDTQQADSWRQALHINLGTLINNTTLIRQIANSLQLAGRGRSAIESIDRTGATVSEFLDLKHAGDASQGRLRALYTDMCRENDRLKRDFAALLAGLQTAMTRDRNAGELAWSGGSHHRDGGSGAANIVRFRMAAARNAGFEDG